MKNALLSTANAPAREFKSPLRYPGGKQKAIEIISAKFPSKFAEYREPMVGGGSVYFRARTLELAQKYWINDLFEELVVFWKTVQDQELCERLILKLEELRQSFSSAEEIKEYFLSARNEETDCEFRMAELFFFFNRVTFSGTTRAGGFSSAASTNRFTASSIQKLQSLPIALSETKISRLDFEELIVTPGTDVFIFLDPPYYTANRLYGKNGSLHNFDHERLASALQKTRHRFLITYDDCPELRKMYSWAKVEEWQLQYGMNNCNSQKTSKIGSELFISNY